jgi:hypothetical protein
MTLNCSIRINKIHKNIQVIPCQPFLKFNSTKFQTLFGISYFFECKKKTRKNATFNSQNQKILLKNLQTKPKSQPNYTQPKLDIKIEQAKKGRRNTSLLTQESRGEGHKR